MNSRIRILALALLLALCLAGPAAAYYNILWPDEFQDHDLKNPVGSFSFQSTAIDSQAALDKIAFMVRIGQSVNFTVRMNNGEVHSGYIRNDGSMLDLWQTLTINLDGSEKSYSQPGIISQRGFLVSYVVNNATDSPEYYLGLVQSGIVGGFNSDIAVDPVFIDIIEYFGSAKPGEGVLIPLSTAPSQNPMIGIYGNTATGIDKITARIVPLQALYQNEQDLAILGGNFVDFVISNLGVLYGYFLLFWEILRFIISNIGLILITIEGGLLAYNMFNSRNVFEFFEKSITMNKKLIFGLIGFVQLLIAWIGDLIGLINPMRYIFGR